MGNDNIYGGSGNDILYGLSGRDRFVFDENLDNLLNFDTIKDFTIGVDKIVLDDDIFTAFLGKTVVSSLLLFGKIQYQQVTSVSELSKSSYLTYVTDNKTLYYDSDGTGTGDIKVAVIQITGTSTFTVSDFEIIA